MALYWLCLKTICFHNLSDKDFRKSSSPIILNWYNSQNQWKFEENKYFQKLLLNTLSIHLITTWINYNVHCYICTLPIVSIGLHANQQTAPSSQVYEPQRAGKWSICWFYTTLHQKDDHHHILISIWWSRIANFFSEMIENWILGEKLAFWVRALDVYCMVCLELLQRAITSGRILQECVAQCFRFLWMCRGWENYSIDSLLKRYR